MFQKRDKLTVPKVYGNLGEIFAIKQLSRDGYEVCRADRIDCLGHSLLTDESKKNFDCQNLFELSKLCKKHFKCRVENIIKPCEDRNSTFYKFNPNPSQYFSPVNDGKFNYYCALKLSYTASLDISDQLFKGKYLFLRRYLQIHNYIHNCYDYPYKKFDESDEQQLKAFFKFWDGHPGRIDLFALKNNQYYCYEVKVNTSKLKKWQVVRLHWMKTHGYNAGVYRVKFRVKDNDWLFSMFEQEKYEEIFDKINPDFEIEDFNLLKFKQYQEAIPSETQIKKYLEMGFHFIDIERK